MKSNNENVVVEKECDIFIELDTGKQICLNWFEVIQLQQILTKQVNMLNEEIDKSKELLYIPKWRENE